MTKPADKFAIKNTLAYVGRMSRTIIDLDEEACSAVMCRYQLTSKRDAVNFALRTLAADCLSRNEPRQLRGSGWEGDLDGMRTARASLSSLILRPATE